MDIKKKTAAALRKIANRLSPVPNSFMPKIGPDNIGLIRQLSGKYDIKKLCIAYECDEIERHQRELLIFKGNKTKENFIEHDQRRIEESIFKAIREKGLIQFYRRYDEYTKTEVIIGEILVGVKKGN